jgi:hypothetical protein
MWWRLTRAIIVSWLVGVACGALLVVVLQQQGERTAPVASETDQHPAQTTGSAP